MPSKVVCFNLFHLSSIQQGIQAGHAAVALVRKYPTHKLIKQWADKDKTLIIKNGGTVWNLKRIIKSIPKDIPYAIFREPDMGNITTSVAVLIVESRNWHQCCAFSKYLFETELAR